MFQWFTTFKHFLLYITVSFIAELDFKLKSIVIVLEAPHRYWMIFYLSFQFFPMIFSSYLLNNELFSKLISSIISATMYSFMTALYMLLSVTLRHVSRCCLWKYVVLFCWRIAHLKISFILFRSIYPKFTLIEKLFDSAIATSRKKEYSNDGCPLTLVFGLSTNASGNIYLNYDMQILTWIPYTFL